MMYTFLPTLTNMTLTGSFIILFVLLARLLLRKAPKIYSYALWAVVLFRLLCPVSFSAPVSLLGALEAPAATQTHTVEYISPTIVHDAYPYVDIPVTTIDNAINDSLPQGLEQTVADPLEFPVSLATILWLWGMAALLTYSVISLLFLRRKLIGAVPLGGNVYLADHIDSPFVMGLVRPKIYLPSTLSEAEQSYILLHERHHIRRYDHIWKLLGFVALCIHWFNPLVWLSFVLATKDMEMSCDEAVLKKMGGDIRADYSASLLSLATGRRIIAGAPLAFGEGDTKSRIKNALKWREAPAWVKALCALLCGLVVVLCAANPAEKDTTAPEPFGHSYRVAEILYDDPKTSEPFESWVQGAFTLTADYSLTSREGNTWLNIGSFQESDLPEAIDAQLRKDNKKAWKCVASEAPATALYYLMLQKDGSVLMAHGYTASPSNPQDTISWVWKMERTDYVTCQVQGENNTTDLGHLGWYPDGFDFDYDSLHSATVRGTAFLTFTVEDAPNILKVSEDYYAQSEGGTTIERETYNIVRGRDGTFSLPVMRHNNYDEYAIYYVAYGEGKYVFRVDFPFQADTSNVTADDVETLFSVENPNAVILDSVVAYDGAYGTLGVVLYQEQANMLHLAYVKEDGWSHPVGLGSDEQPLLPVSDPELTYLGNGTVSWLCEQNGTLLRYNMEFSVTGSHTAFRPISAPATNTPPYGYYVTGRQVYASPYSSTLYPDGDDGNRYLIYNDTLVVTDRESGASDTYPVDWTWDDDPFSYGSTEPAPLLRGENVRWQNIYTGLALAHTGGQLYLVALNTSLNSGPEVWSILTLVSDTGYIPIFPLEIAVTEAVRDAFFHNNTINAYGCANHVILDTRELAYDAAIGSTPAGGKLTVVDLIALGVDFRVEEGALVAVRERVLDMKLTFEEREDGYVLTDKESTVLPDTGDYGLPLYQGCYSQAVSYFGIDTETVIAKLMAPAASFTSVLPLDFMFSSGAGAWRTNLTLNADLTFTGEHLDADAGKHYVCSFSGRFEALAPISKYACALTLAELNTEKAEGEEWMEDGIQYIAVGPYGMEDSSDFILYLPGTPASLFSEEFAFYYPEDAVPETLPCCVLYNAGTGDYFFTAAK